MIWPKLRILHLFLFWPKIQRIFRIYKGKKFPTFFSFFYICKEFISQNRMNRCNCCGPDGRLDTKIDQIAQCHISMSYATFVIIWHFMSYDAYDIQIWRKSIWSILVSKRPSGPQQLHPSIQFWLNNCLKIKIFKNTSKFVSLYKFWKSFVFSAETVIKSGHRRNHLSAILLVFLGFPDLIQWQNTWARIAKPTWVFLARPSLTCLHDLHSPLHCHHCPH